MKSLFRDILVVLAAIRNVLCQFRVFCILPITSPHCELFGFFHVA